MSLDKKCPGCDHTMANHKLFGCIVQIENPSSTFELLPCPCIVSGDLTGK